MKKEEIQTKIQSEDTTLVENVLEIKRVSKKNKGGNRLGFTALVAVGDNNGMLGVGLGKAKDVRSAIDKGSRKAKNDLRSFPLVKTTIPHPLVVSKGAVRLIMKPAPVGSGIMAGGVLRPLFELSGIRDISVKNVGTRNRFSVVFATLEALQGMKPREEK